MKLTHVLTLLFFCAFISVPFYGQNQIKAFELTNDDAKTKIMLLGVFHFENPGLDDYKSKYKLDIQSEAMQSQIKQVVHQLSAFQPTKIGVEFEHPQQPKMDSLYRSYQDGKFALPDNEIYQLGFRLAKAVGLDRVHGIDARGKNYAELNQLSPEAYNQLAKKYMRLGLRAKPKTKIWYPTYEKIYALEDSLKAVTPLNEFLLHINSQERVEFGHGIYVVDSFKFGLGKAGDYFGADMKTYWYNRNLRILQNIYRMIDAKEDRVLIIIGAGHLSILRHAIAASPELSLVEVDTYLR